MTIVNIEKLNDEILRDYEIDKDIILTDGYEIRGDINILGHGGLIAKVEDGAVIGYLLEDYSDNIINDGDYKTLAIGDIYIDLEDLELGASCYDLQGVASCTDTDFNNSDYITRARALIDYMGYWGISGYNLSITTLYDGYKRLHDSEVAR